MDAALSDTQRDKATEIDHQQARNFSKCLINPVFSCRS